MIRIEDHCVGCDLPCLGSTCPMRNVEVHYCDKCGEQLDEIYRVDDIEVCEECLLNMFKAW
jgi:hypothetical protein